MEYLTTKEAALASRRHPETITAALRDGELHGTQRKKSGRWLIERGCLDDWVAQIAYKHSGALDTAA